MSRRLLSRQSTVREVMSTITSHAGSCPCHSCASRVMSRSRRALSQAGSARSTDYAFQMESSTFRFGRGIVHEVGHDMRDLGATKVAVVTDPNLKKTIAFERAVGALDAQKIPYAVWDETRCEPTDESMQAAIGWARAQQCDAYLAIGGGSSMDTAKVANLMTVHPENELDDFVNAPIGKGLPIPRPLHPLVAVVTTAGTGSEATGTAIFDHLPSRAKTGIGSRRLRPTLGLCDPDLVGTMPRAVAMASGLDVLCHAIESYTAIPYDQRSPRPATPAERPAYQGDGLLMAS